MISRYSRPRMAAIWEAENRYRIWFEIEAHALDAMAELGVVPKEAARKVWDWWATGPAILLAIGGTSLAPFVIERMTDHGFRQWTRAIIFAISVVFLARAAWLFWHG